MLSGDIPIKDTQRHYIESLTVLDYTFSGLTSLLQLVGAALLFLLRRQALYCFGSVFIISVFDFTHQIIFKNLVAAVGSMNVVINSVVFALGLHLAILIYVWYLYATKILR